YNIARGKDLWYRASLVDPSRGNVTMRASCTHCHAQDGRDLYYYNYSNKAIEQRAVFHGLTSTQGKQIASYIRNLGKEKGAYQSIFGRPWNPPYQPGPGTDSR